LAKGRPLTWFSSDRLADLASKSFSSVWPIPQIEIPQ